MNNAQKLVVVAAVAVCTLGLAEGNAPADANPLWQPGVMCQAENTSIDANISYYAGTMAVTNVGTTGAWVNCPLLNSQAWIDPEGFPTFGATMVVANPASGSSVNCYCHSIDPGGNIIGSTWQSVAPGSSPTLFSFSSPPDTYGVIGLSIECYLVPGASVLSYSLVTTE